MGLLSHHPNVGRIVKYLVDRSIGQNNIERTMEFPDPPIKFRIIPKISDIEWQ